MRRLALALSALLFAACDPTISPVSIDAGPWDAGGMDCEENPCLNAGICHGNTEGGFTCACPPGYEGDLCEIDVNDCDPNPCMNDGVCSDRVASYSCACAPGFTGVDCSTNVDECADGPCQNGGTCTDLVNGYQCDCSAGYSGSRCEVDVDDCSTMPCENEGECQDEVNGFTCVCKEGNTGPTCSNQVEVCGDDTCQHGGTCENTDEGYKCTCAAGYNGANCESDIDDCAALPCQNGANCVDQVNGYECQCLDGYEGVNCENLVDPCNPNPCQNDGTCTSAGDYFVCSCQSGYNGASCERNINDCLSNPCANGGACTDQVDGFTCECTTGFTGPTCNNEPSACPTPNPCVHGQCQDGINGYKCACDDGYIGATCELDVDDCQPNPCAHGTCADGVNDYECTCDDGYEGPSCEGNVDDCVDEPCKNGGECADLLNGFQCSCAPGWGGDTCEANIDDCDPNPCQNDGTCTDDVNSFSCDCKPGFQGDRCEEEHCQLIGVCGNGMCDGQGGCICDTGWEGPTCLDDIDECATGTPCLHGNCTDMDGGFSCDCAEGYQGQLCDLCADGYQDGDQDLICCVVGYKGSLCNQCDDGYEDVNGVCQHTCTSAPKDCGEHGMCDDASGDTTCLCDPTYFGELCDSLMGTCSAGVCGTNGACSPTSTNTFKCTCNPGYIGRNCEILDECALAVSMGETPCKNNGTCIDGNNSYTCECATGWTGADCSETQDCEVAVGLGVSPCNDHGICVDGDNSYTCTCSAGWLGAACDEPDNCVGNTCQNGSTCVDGSGTYTCDCTGLDYEGEFCQLPSDDCAPTNPCANGGQCSNVGEGFACDCARTGFTGITCQDDFDECTDANICGTGTCDNVTGGYTCQCPDGTLDVSGDGTSCAQVVSVSAGTLNTCAISAAGSLHCWGDNAHGQLAQGFAGNPDASEIRTPKRIGTGTDWSKVSVGGRHICGLRNGHMFCWGDNTQRQSRSSGDLYTQIPIEVRPDVTWTDVSLGDSHSCALAGTALYCWGNSTDGQAGVATVGSDVDAPKQISGTWSQVSAGSFHTCAINMANELHCWGRNVDGQTGGTPPVLVPAGGDGTWSSVEAGPMHTCAVAGTHTYCWGEGSKGALGNGASADNTVPQQVTFAQSLGSLQTGTDFSCGATSTLEVYCWGTNDFGLLLEVGGDVNTPTLVSTSNTLAWADYAVGTQHMCGVDNGLVNCWGNNADGAVGNAPPGVAPVTEPARVKSALITHSGSNYCSPNPCQNGGLCTSSASGFTCDCTGTGFGGANCTSTNDECTTTPGICGQGTCRDLLDDDGYSCTCPDGLIDVDQTGEACEKVGLIAAGVNHSCVLTETSRTLHCWGSNRYGQFGLGGTGTTSYYPNENSQTYRTPLRLRTISGVTGDVSGWTHLVVGENITCGTLPNGSAESLYCWGDNSLGAVGVGTISLTYNTEMPPVPTAATVAPILHASPVLLDATRTWISLATSYATTCGVDMAGDLYCWGLNKYGQAGNGGYGNPQITDGTYSFVPIMYSQATAVPPPTGETWVSVAPGNTTTCARTNLNNVYCWGRRNVGQTGTGGANNQPDLFTPTRVNRADDPQGFTSVYADITHACGLVGTSAFCWGQGTTGGIGNGASVTQSSPTAVSGALSFSSLTLGSNFGCGLVAVPSTTPQAYTAYCWGNNFRDMLLTGVANVNVPTLVNTSRQWERLDLGPSHACGVDQSDSRLYCWGDNGVELGSGQGKVGSVPASQIGNVGLVGPVKAASVTHPAP